ncbi:MAG: hypothetical protein C0598_05930 [Marinilabiliales bacterium]|nr:MAG: hypothetical protein C0598_05930 [Marinilabiliales bacterium]
MKDKIANITRWILILLLAVSVIPGVLFYVDMLDTDTFLNIAKMLLIVAVAIMIISPVYGLITNPKNLVKLLISLGLIVVIVFIGYSMAGDAVSETQEVKFGLTQTSSKMVGTGLYVTYIAFGLTVLSLLYSSIIKIFK